MKNTVFFAIAGFCCLMSCSNVSTSASLRPELGNNDIEIWEIYGGGNAYASYDEVYRSIKKEAAQRSNAEGMDCFVMLDSKAKTYTYTKSTTTKETRYAQADTYGTIGNANFHGRTNYSYEVPVTKTSNYSKPTSSWYVIFHTSEECRDLRKTQWRDRIYYNDNVIEKARSEEKTEFIVGVVGVSIVLIVLAIYAVVAE